VAPQIRAGQGTLSANARVVGSAGQAFEKLKVSVDEAESEWANLPVVVEAPSSSLNHRPDRAAKPADHRAPSSETLDEPLKLASGERRILTALAQYPEGRSKVQVVVLTGYAATGGGFNNYLGAPTVARDDPRRWGRLPKQEFKHSVHGSRGRQVRH
jgi:hypothetical protein